MLPSVRLTLSEKLGQEEMGREGEKEAQNQHKNRNIKVSFSRQTSRDGAGEEIKNKKQKKKTKQKPQKRKKINLGNVMVWEGEEGKADLGRPPWGGAQGTDNGQCDCLLVCTGHGENIEPGLRPTLPAGQFLPAPAPTWLHCHLISSQGPSARPLNTSRFFHTRSPSVLDPCTHETLGVLWCSKFKSPRALTLSRRLRSSSRSRRNGRAVKMIL